MNEKQQEKYLQESIADLQSGAALQRAKELTDAWETADQKAFEKLANDIKNDRSVKGKFVRNFLQEARNPAMAAKIETHLMQDKISFAGIDILHLMGNDSVPQLLSRDGYQVTRLY